MSAPVDVLAVMTVSERLLANSDFHGAVAYVNRVTEARAAVAELIEADKEYDAASEYLAANPDPNPDAESTPEQWASYSKHLDAKERMRAARNRRDAALAKCGGGE